MIPTNAIDVKWLPPFQHQIVPVSKAETQAITHLLAYLIFINIKYTPQYSASESGTRKGL